MGIFGEVIRLYILTLPEHRCKSIKISGGAKIFNIKMSEGGGGASIQLN